MLVCTKCYSVYKVSSLYSGSVKPNEEGKFVCPSTTCAGHELIEVDDQMVDVVLGLWTVGIRTTESCSGHPRIWSNNPYIILELDESSFAVVSMMRHLNNGRATIMVNQEEELIIIEGMEAPEGDISYKHKAQYEFFQFIYEVFNEMGSLKKLRA